MSFDQGSELVSNEDVEAVLLSLAPNADVDDEYDHFLQPDYEQVKRMLAVYWNSCSLHYGSNAPDFPLCYDFAELCAAKVREAAVRERMKARLAFGTLRYTRHDGRHAICFVVTAQEQVKYYEPQNGMWMDEPVDVKSLDNFDI